MAEPIPGGDRLMTDVSSNGARVCAKEGRIKCWLVSDLDLEGIFSRGDMARDQTLDGEWRRTSRTKWLDSSLVLERFN